MNLFDALQVDEYNRADIQRLREEIHVLQRYSDFEIEKLYESFSDGVAASWLVVDEHSIDQFRYWLNV